MAFTAFPSVRARHSLIVDCSCSFFHANVIAPTRNEMNDITKLLEIVRHKNAIDQQNTWYNGSDTYFAEIHKELAEVKAEIESGRQPHLEEELGDVLWDYLNLLTALESEGKITLEKVFERAITKYWERIDGIENGGSWAEIKAIQKARLAKELKT